jgi:hypothetical protein
VSRRASSGLALVAIGATLLVAMLIPGAPVSIKIVGLTVVAVGLTRFGLPRRVTEWLRDNSGRLTEVVDPSAEAVAEMPRVPLDDLLDPPPAEGAGDEQAHQP